ncbi:hypothetical protein RchiOBHm_Chr2g0140881 [Rosa chinensis]|uniref:Uncharacterized protein n=1 Tax=Rosa chinensis TaxID=74649 RepID=A0A2P6RXJ4_ROSCH|nr:hypothetical protein RchiOBHm_Chr2g0140881 [Rosa chinensis]
MVGIAALCIKRVSLSELKFLLKFYAKKCSRGSVAAVPLLIVQYYFNVVHFFRYGKLIKWVI